VCCAGNKYSIGLLCTQNVLGLKGISYRSDSSYENIGLGFYTSRKRSLVAMARSNIGAWQMAASDQRTCRASPSGQLARKHAMAQMTSNVSLICWSLFPWR
jgi:hypothetical protein